MNPIRYDVPVTCTIPECQQDHFDIETWHNIGFEDKKHCHMEASTRYITEIFTYRSTVYIHTTATVTEELRKVNDIRWRSLPSPKKVNSTHVDEMLFSIKISMYTRKLWIIVDGLLPKQLSKLIIDYGNDMFDLDKKKEDAVLYVLNHYSNFLIESDKKEHADGEKAKTQATKLRFS